MARDTFDTSSWLTAYKAFLLDKDESFILKVAPLAILLGMPEILASNLIPGVGEIIDLSGLGVTSVVLFRTYLAVRRHRNPSEVRTR
jgi:hypothetical protein